MRQSDFLLGPSTERRDMQTALAAFGHILRVDSRATLGIVREACKSQKNTDLIRKRSRHIQAIYFNLNILSDHECVLRYRMKKCHVGVVVDAVSWDAGMTKRNRYRCDPLTATCIMLRKMAGPIQWVDVKKKFGMRTSHLSKAFWEVLERFIKLRGGFLSIRQDLLRARSEPYRVGFKNLRAPLERCMRFPDCTKIQICRPRGANANERSVYSGHKRMH